MAKPNWRVIETALLDIFATYGLEVEDDHGDHFITLRQGNAPAVEYSIEDLARELEKRL